MIGVALGIGGDAANNVSIDVHLLETFKLHGVHSLSSTSFPHPVVPVVRVSPRRRAAHSRRRHSPLGQPPRELCAAHPRRDEPLPLPPVPLGAKLLDRLLLRKRHVEQRSTVPRRSVSFLFAAALAAFFLFLVAGVLAGAFLAAVAPRFCLSFCFF